MKMLLMDDDHDFRSIQKELFQRDGYDVVEAATLVAAEEALASYGEDFDVAILDMNMPPEAEGGLRIARAIHDRYPMIPSLVLTANAATDNASRCMLEGVCAYVGKNQGKEELPLGLRYCHGQRVARIRNAIERAMAAWWMKTGGVALRDSSSRSERQLIPLIMQHFHVMEASMLCRPMPNHQSKLTAIRDMLPLVGYHGPVRLEYNAGVDDMPDFRIRSEVDAFPELQTVFKLFFRHGDDQSVLLSFAKQGSYVVLVFELGAGAAPDGVVRFNKIIKGGELESENEALVAIWAVQLTALRGLSRIEHNNNGTCRLMVALPTE